MSNYWFLAKGKKKPYSLKRLKQLASSGLLKPDDLVLQSGWQIWEKAGEIPGLFPPNVTIEPRLSSKTNDNSNVQPEEVETIIPEKTASNSSDLLKNVKGWHVVVAGLLFVLGIFAMIEAGKTPQQKHQEYIDSRGKALQQDMEAERQRRIIEEEVRIRAIQEDMKKNPQRYK